MELFYIQVKEKPKPMDLFERVNFIKLPRHVWRQELDQLLQCFILRKTKTLPHVQEININN